MENNINIGNLSSMCNNDETATTRNDQPSVGSTSPPSKNTDTSLSDKCPIFQRCASVKHNNTVIVILISIEELFSSNTFFHIHIFFHICVNTFKVTNDLIVPDEQFIIANLSTCRLIKTEAPTPEFNKTNESSRSNATAFSQNTMEQARGLNPTKQASTTSNKMKITTIRKRKTRKSPRKQTAAAKSKADKVSVESATQTVSTLQSTSSQTLNHHFEKCDEITDDKVGDFAKWLAFALENSAKIPSKDRIKIMEEIANSKEFGLDNIRRINKVFSVISQGIEAFVSKNNFNDASTVGIVDDFYKNTPVHAPDSVESASSSSSNCPNINTTNNTIQNDGDEIVASRSLSEPEHNTNLGNDEIRAETTTDSQPTQLQQQMQTERTSSAVEWGASIGKAEVPVINKL